MTLICEPELPEHILEDLAASGIHILLGFLTKQPAHSGNGQPLSVVKRPRLGALDFDSQTLLLRVTDI